MNSLFFYKNNTMKWRWEGNNKIIIYCNDKYWKLNELASLIFYYCEGVNLNQLIQHFVKSNSSDRKYFVETISKFLRTLSREGIIISQSMYNGIPQEKPILDSLPFNLKETNIMAFDISSMSHLDFARPEAPLRIFFTVGHECNLRCKSCYNPIDKNKNSKFYLNKAKDIIDSIKNAGVFEVILTGGEPFLNLYIFEIIDYILSRGMKVRINTNGLILGDEHIMEIKKRKDLTLTIGIDGISENTNDFLRGAGNFKKVMKVLEKLSMEMLNIYINFTVTHQNFSDIWRLRGFFRNFNVLRIFVNIFIAAGEGFQYSNVLTLNKLEFATIKLFNLFNTTDRKPILTTITSCYAGHIEANIDYEGLLFFCELLNYPLGNVLEEDIKKIWNSPAMLSLTDVDNFGVPCKRCFFRKGCRGSCRAEVFSATGNIYSGNHNCLKGKFFKIFEKGSI